MHDGSNRSMWQIRTKDGSLLQFPSVRQFGGVMLDGNCCNSSALILCRWRHRSIGSMRQFGLRTFRLSIVDTGRVDAAGETSADRLYDLILRPGFGQDGRKQRDDESDGMMKTSRRANLCRRLFSQKVRFAFKKSVGITLFWISSHGRSISRR